MTSAARQTSLAVALATCLLALPVHAASTPQGLPFTQDWTNAGLITANDDWSGVAGIDGFRGDDITTGTGTDPQTLVASDTPGVVDVNANQTNPATFNTGGVAEFALANPVVALTGSGTGDAPYLKLYLNTTGASGVNVAYTVRDLDGSTDNAVQPVALQYRVGNSGNFTNVAAAFVADGTSGPSLATLATPVSVLLPAAANNQPLVELRIMTTNAVGNDEWVGIDDISITAGAAPLSLAINDVTVTEGDAGTTTASFTVSLSAPAGPGGVTFDIATADGSAVAGDYDPRVLTGILPMGVNSYTFDVVVNGDIDVETNESYFVNVTNVLGAAVADGQGSGTILTDDFSITAIHDLQGSGRNSPLAGGTAVIQGIVTARRSNGFYLQARDADADADPATSEGVFVFTSGAPPVSAAIGAELVVSGNVAEFTPSSNPHQQPLTELTSPVIESVESTGNALPTAVQITSALASPTGPVDALERLEGMRVTIASLDASAPGEGFIDENDALSSANGNFWGVVSGVARPFREPGVGVLDVGVILPVNTPRFDTNPERIRVQSTGQTGAAVIAVDAGATVTGLVGVLDYGFGTYTLLPDPSASVVVTGGATPTAVSDALSTDYTIAGFNLLRFYDDVNDAGGDVQLTTLAFERRLAKTANAICAYVKTPDILGVVEVENLNALNRLAQAINTNIPGTCTRNPQYVAYLEEGNDVGKINVGFLVSMAELSAGVPRVNVVDVVQYGKATTQANPNTTTSLLNDRPPLVLRAVVNHINGTNTPVTVIANHLRSLNGVNSTDPGSNGWATDGARIRAKRAEQSLYLADLVHTRQQAAPAEQIVLLGDFNAFEYNDGYADVMGVVTGREAANDAVLNYVDSPITVPLTNLTTLSDAADRYSYSFEGNVQTLDHIVVNQSVFDAAPDARIEHARINADFGTDNFGDDSVPLRVSDHDPVVLYLSGPLLAELAVNVSADAASAAAGADIGFDANLANTGPNAGRDVLVRFRANARLPAMTVAAPAGFICAAPVLGAAETVVECAAATLAVGAVDFSITATTVPALAGTSLSLSATVEATSNDNNPANNVDTAMTSLVLARGDLSVTTAEKPAATIPGRQATFGFEVRNRNTDPVFDPTLDVAFELSFGTITVIPTAGWSCTVLAAPVARSNHRCVFAGRYDGGRSDRLRFRIDTTRPTVAKVTATVSSPTLDTVTGNNKSTGQVVLAAIPGY